MRETKSGSAEVANETCSCGGEAKFLRSEGGIPILQCDRCGDTFAAD